MKEKKKEKRDITIREKAMRLVLVAIAFAIPGSATLWAANIQSAIISIAIIVIAIIAFAIIMSKVIFGYMDDCGEKSRLEAMEKVRIILCHYTYTPIEYIGNNASLISLYAEALEKFDCTIAAKLSEEDKILYAIVDANRNVVGRVECKEDAIFFINNFKI